MPKFLESNQYQPFMHETFGRTKVSTNPLKGGLLNQNIRIDSKGISFVLKIYRPEVDSNKLAETHRLLNFVQKRDIPVALPIASQQIDGYQAAIYPLLKGEHPPRLRNSQKNLFIMGEMLGRIHKALEKFSPKKDKSAMDMMNKEKVAAGFREIDGLLHSARKADRAFLQPVVKFQKTLFARDNFDYQRQSKLPLCYCHGDFHFANILMNKDAITGVLDWEKAAYMSRSQELMRSLLFNTRVSIGKFSLPGIRAFISGYKQHVTLTPLEKELMFEVGFRKYAFDFWAMRQFLSGQRSLRSNIKRRFLGSKTLAREQEVYKNKIAEFLG